MHPQHTPPPPREGYPLTTTWRESVSNKIRKKEEDERKMEVKRVKMGKRKTERMHMV
jgi:hypothetical protein